jgi:hypothetical protein
MYISYDSLIKGPVVCKVGDSIVSFQLAHQESDICIMKLNPKFKFSDNSFLITENSDATIPVGTRFQLEYKGTVCDFWIGRRFLIRDA